MGTTEDQSSDEIGALLDRLARGYTERDLDALMECFSDEVEVTVYGTGADERRVGRDALIEQFHRDWNQSESATFSPVWVKGGARGDVMWCAADLTLAFRADGDEVSWSGRSSIVAVREGGTWRVVHWHISVPYGGQELGSSF